MESTLQKSVSKFNSYLSGHPIAQAYRRLVHAITIGDWSLIETVRKESRTIYQNPRRNVKKRLRRLVDPFRMTTVQKGKFKL